MKNYYNSNSIFEASIKDGFTSALASMLGKTKCMFGLVMFMILAIGQFSWAQNTANYAFSTNTTSSLALDLNGNPIDMSTGTTQLVGAGLDAAASPVTNIGFNFIFMGSNYTQYSVSEDGLLQLGGGTVPTNTYSIIGGTATAPRLGAFNSDMRTGTTTGKIHYKLVGTAPNRVLVIEFKDMTLFYTAAAAAGNSNFQMRLYETSGNIEYVYGTMNVTLGTPASGTSIGFYTGSAAGNFSSVNYLTNTYTTTGTYAANTTPATLGAVTNLDSATNGSRRAYVFIPPGNIGNPIATPIAAPTALAFGTVSPSTIQLNWTAASPITGVAKYIVSSSTDGGTTYTIQGATNVGTNTYTVTGLLPATSYMFKVYATSEGVKSTDITGTQSTAAITTYVWNATTGSASWATPASWTPARTTPDSTDILQFSNGGNSTATGITTQTVGRMEFSNNTTTNLQASATATLTSNKLVIPAGSALFSDGNTAALTLAFSAGAVNPIDGRLEINNSGFANTITFANSVTTIGTTGNLAAGGILAGAITGTATTLVINGTYEHKYTTVAGTIPTATWNATSNTNITGYTTNTTATGGFTQSFNNFKWDCPLQTGNLNLASSGTTGVAGTFTITNTGTGSLRWTGTGGYTVNANNFTQTGGSFDLGSGNAGTGTFNVAGTFSKTAGTFQSTGTVAANPTLNFNGTALQSVTFDAQPAGPITYRVVNPIGITLNGSFGTSFALGNGTLGGLRISTLSANPVTFGGTLTDFTYNAANSRLTYDATGSQTVRALEWPVVAGPSNLTVGIGSANVLTLPFSRSLACVTVNSVLTMTSGDIDLSSNTLILGASAAFPGTLSWTAGSIRTTTGSFVRWFPTTGLPTTAGTNIGYYPLASGISNRNVSLSFSTATALSAGGTVGISHSNVAGISAVSPSIVDGAYTVDTKGNSSWTIATGNGIAASGTIGLRLTGGNAISTPTVANLRVIQTTTALGTHVAGTGTTPNFQANRSGLSIADITTTHYIGAAAADITNSYNSITSGNWNATTTWSSGIVPGCNDVVNITSGTTVTVNSAASNAKNITVASGATLTMASGDLTVGCTLFNNFLNNNGTLILNGGTLTVNGNVANAATSTFTQTNGELVIDGNNGIVAESVATGVNLLNFTNNAVTLSGGKITIVDPHLIAGTTSNFSIQMNNATAVANTLSTSPNHTLQLGNGVSTEAGGTGFYIDNWTTTTYLAFGKVVVKGPTGTNRALTSRYNFTANGDIIVENGGTINLGVPLFFGGNIDVQTGGTFTNTSAATTGVITANTGSALTSVPVTVAQTITNTGTLGNLLTASTANFAGLTINNTNATGVTLNSPISTVALTLTAGLVNTTNTNLLTVGTATAAGTITGGSATAYVNGPLAKTIANANTNTTYSVFPVGKGAVYSPISLAPLTTAVSVFKAESFNTNTGTADPMISNLSAVKRWETSSTSGTFTNINVRLGDTPISATSIPVQAPTAAGVYTNAFGTTATYAAGTPNTTTSNTALASGSFTGFLSYAGSNVCVTPTPGATTATSNALCSGQSTTLGITNTPSATFGVTYQWQSSTDNVTYTDISGATSATYTVTPTASLYYQAVVTCATGPSTGTSTPLQITFANSITGTTPGSVCGQGTVSLAATGNAGSVLNWYSTPTSTTSLATGSPFVTPVITANTTYYVSASSSIIGAGTLAIGTGTALTGATEQPTAFCNRWPSYLSQTIYTAAELTAQGLSAGNITSMAYNITTLGDGANNANFNVKIGTTSGTNFANNTLLSTTAYTDVFGPSTYTHTATGLQTITFTTPFVWDGTSNIVVYTSMSGADSINNSQTYYTTTADNKMLWQRSGDVTTNAVSNRRLNIVFGGQVTLACNSVRVPVVATVTTPPALTLSSNAISVCSGQTSAPITISTGAASYDTYTFSPTSGVSGTAVTGFSFNPAATTSYTLTASQSSGSLCTTVQTIVVTVNQTPSALTLTSPVTTCPNTITPLVATGGTLSNVSILSENFNAATNNWTTVNNTTGGATPAAAAWTLRADGYTYPFYATWHSNDNSQFYLTNADAPGNGSTTNTLLQSPAFSTTNFTSVNLAFYNYVFENTAGLTTAKVQASTNGTTWVDLQTITPATTNAATPFTLSTVALTPAFLNQPTVYIRFNYSSAWRFFWGIDNVSIAGTQSTSVAWSPTTNLFTDALATIPYTGTNTTTVYHMATAATAATTYTATASSSAPCTVTATTTVTVNAPSAQPTATSPQSINDPATIANIAITGTGIVWYASSANAIAGTGALPTTTPLVDNTTYYATQTTAGGCPSAPIAVLVNIVLRNNSFNMGSLVYYPNPVVDILNISYSNTISNIEVYNLLGQIVRTTQPNAISTQLDMSNLPTATYMIKVTSEGKTATIKIVKK